MVAAIMAVGKFLQRLRLRPTFTAEKAAAPASVPDTTRFFRSLGEWSGDFHPRETRQRLGSGRLNLICGQVAIDGQAVRRGASHEANAEVTLAEDMNRRVLQAVIAPGARDEGPIQNAHSMTFSILPGASGRATMTSR
jgi:hypothetical protein